MNHNEIFDILVHEFRTMYNQHLIRIIRDNAIHNNNIRSFRFLYNQRVERRIIEAQILIEVDRGHLTVEHYRFINDDIFRLSFPFGDHFVILHLLETFREWVLRALTVPIHEREANFQAYLRGEKLRIAYARRLASSHLPGIPDDIGGEICRYIR